MTMNEEQYIAMLDNHDPEYVIERIQWAVQILHGAKAHILLYVHWDPSPAKYEARTKFNVFNAIVDYAYQRHNHGWYESGLNAVLGIAEYAYLRSHDEVFKAAGWYQAGPLNTQRTETNHALEITSVEGAIRELQELLAKMKGLRPAGSKR